MRSSYIQPIIALLSYGYTEIINTKSHPLSRPNTLGSGKGREKLVYVMTLTEHPTDCDILHFPET